MARTPRTPITIQERQKERLRNYCEAHGRNMADIIRSALDQYLAPWEKLQSELEAAKQLLTS